MCNAFSAIVTKDGKVYWKAGMDSHDKLMEEFNLSRLDNTCSPDDMTLAKVEITPPSDVKYPYLHPELKWILKIDERREPFWWDSTHAFAANEACDKWKEQIYSGINLKEALNPIDPRKIRVHEVTEADIAALKKWASVRASVSDSVRASVWDSVRDSVRASVWDSVRASVWDSVRASVRASVGASVGASVRASVCDSVWASVCDSVWASVCDSVWAYQGSLFTKITDWKYIKHESGIYPYQPSVDLWKRGFVPSFDGKIWRLHQGKDMKVVYEIKKFSIIYSVFIRFNALMKKH
jgi:hypothetical protein